MEKVINISIDNMNIDIDNSSTFKDFCLQVKNAGRPDDSLRIQIDSDSNILEIDGVKIGGTALHLLKEFLKQL